LGALILARFLPGKIAMIVHAIRCPHCHKPDAVVKYGTNRSRTARCLCKDCKRTFTPQPNPRGTSQQTKEAVERALAERLSQRAIARCFQVSFQTIRAIARDAQKNTHLCQTV